MNDDQLIERGSRGIGAVADFLKRKRVRYELVEHAETFASVDEACAAGTSPARIRGAETSRLPRLHLPLSLAGDTVVTLPEHDDATLRIVDEPSGNASSVCAIVLADDHAIVRRAVRNVLELEVGFEVVAEAGDIGTTIRKVRAYKPTVLVLDLNMPGGSSLDAIPTLLEASPRSAIVVLTMDDSLEAARACLRAGACGFALKEAADTGLVDAVHAAARGHRYLDPQLGSRIAIDPEMIERPDNLSARELEVLKLIALGYTNHEIAHELCLSVRTVESHRSHVQHKIDTTTRAEVFSYARKHSLV